MVSLKVAYPAPKRHQLETLPYNVANLMGPWGFLESPLILFHFSYRCEEEDEENKKDEEKKTEEQRKKKNR